MAGNIENDNVKQVLGSQIAVAWTLHVVFALQPGRWISDSPSVQLYVGVS
jgi:hypothetical protein